MTQRSDETFALELLKNHLEKSPECEFRCEVNGNDPPDLVVTWEGGVQWGVEVTRVYPRGYSATVEAGLHRFASNLRETTASIRKRDYFLILGPPSLFNSQNSVDNKQWRKWKKESEKAIRQHIASGKSCILRRSGVWLRPGNPGRCWDATVNHGVEEIGLARYRMLRRALQDKMQDLPNWNGNFTEQWLLLLNYYPLVDNIAEVKDTIYQLRQGLTGFNGILWSGYADQTLIPISLSQSLS